MASNALRLQIILDGIDKATAPIKAVTQSSSGLARAMKASQDALKGMNKQQADIRSYRIASIEAVKQARAIRDLETKSRGYSQALEQQRAVHTTLRANLRTAQTQYNKLATAMVNGKGSSAEFQRELQKAQIKLTASRQAFERSNASIKTYRERLRNADDRLGRLNQQHRATQERLGGLRTRLNEAGIGTDNLGNKSRKLRAEQEQTNKTLDQQRETLRRLEQQQKRMQGLRDAGTSIHRAGMSVGAHGAAAAYGATNLAQRAGRALGVGMEFDATMSRVQALARLDKGSEQMAALRAQAKKLGAETMFSATDAAQGQAFLAMAGFTPDSIMAAMPGLLDMALAGETDLGRTADIASNILGSFKIDPAEMGKVADVLTKAFTTSNMSLEMLGDTMKYVGPVAAAAGMSLEESAAMAGLLGNVGIQASQAGTTLRSMMLRLSAPTGKAAKALEELGVKSRDSAGNARNMIEVLGDVAEATRNMGTGEQLEYLKTIFGEEPAAGMAQLLSEAGVDGIDGYLAIIRDHAGAAGATAAIIADNLKGDLDELSSAWEGVQVEIFDQNSAGLRELVQQLTAVIDRVNLWIMNNPELASSIAKWAAISLGVIGTLGILAVTVGTTMMALGGLLKMFAASAAVISKSSALVLALGKSFAFLGKAILANPIVIAIALIAAAAYMLWQNWDGVVGGLKALWTDLVNSTRFIWEPMLAFFQGIWTTIRTAFAGGISGISALIINWSPQGLFYQAFAGVMGYFGVDLPGKFTEFGGMLMNGMVQGIRNGLGAVRDAITGAGDQAIGWFKDKLGIRSPSRVFAALGDDTMAGLEQGLERSKPGPLASIIEAGKAIAGAATVSLGVAGTPAVADIAPLTGITVDSRPPLQAAAAPVTVQGDTIHIQITAAPGTDTRELERMVNRVLEERERNKAARIRSSLYDND